MATPRPSDNRCSLACPIKQADGSVVSMREHIEQKLDSLRENLEEWKCGLNVRLATMNEFRESIKDTQVRSVTREEWALQHERVKEDIRSLQMDKSRLEGKADQKSVTFANNLAIISMVLAVFALVSDIVLVFLRAH